MARYVQSALFALMFLDIFILHQQPGDLRHKACIIAEFGSVDSRRNAPTTPSLRGLGQAEAVHKENTKNTLPLESTFETCEQKSQS